MKVEVNDNYDGFQLTRNIRSVSKKIGCDPGLLCEYLDTAIKTKVWESLGIESFSKWLINKNDGCGFPSVEMVKNLVNIVGPKEASTQFYKEQLKTIRETINDTLFFDLEPVNPKSVRKEPSNIKSTVRDTNSATQDNEQYIIARLKRAGEIETATMIVRGEVTANEVAIQKGWRKKYARIRTDDLDKVAYKLHELFSQKEIEYIKDKL